LINWRIQEDGFNKERITANGNKYFAGNGYVGIRGTLQEYEKSEFTAINLAGIYDQVGDAWREPLNAPNGLFTYVEIDGKEYRLPETESAAHSISLDYRHGILSRDTKWNTPSGFVTVKAERFASLKEQHLLAMKYSVHTEGDCELKLFTGIDGDVWDLNGPHYDEMLLSVEDKAAVAIGITHESKDQVCVCETYCTDFPVEEQVLNKEKKLLRALSIHAKAGMTYTLYKWNSVYTSKDRSDYKEVALALVNNSKSAGYEAILESHIAEWEKKWSISEVIIDGDDVSMEALNYSIYHLHCIAPRHAEGISIAARGLSGQTYKGAIFWDTEMFMLDFFLFTEPEVAKSILRYRVDTLEGAKKKAKSYGYQGAFYAWESQEGGYDACSDYNVTDVFTGRPMRTYFKDKQVHISSAVVYGIMRYIDYTGDNELLVEGGAEVILECAAFYYDLLIKKLHLERYEIHDVIGPDEYHERVNNNAYTNQMAKYVFECAVRIIKLIPEFDEKEGKTLTECYDLESLLAQYQDAALNIYVPQPDAITGVIEQFDGYEQLEEVGLEELRSRLLNEKEYWGGAYGIAAHTKIIKQADVVTMLNLFSKEYSDEVLLKNWEYYEPRTEHGSSLSACMYAMLACKCKLQDKAYPLFIKSASEDIRGNGKSWAGLIYIGGTHPASSGGAYMTAVEGFAGIHQKDGVLGAKAQLPPNWKRLLCKVVYRGDLYWIEATQDSVKIENKGKLSC